MNTHRHPPKYTIGVYNSAINTIFIKYHTAIQSGEYKSYLYKQFAEKDDNESDNLMVENHIVELFRDKNKGKQYKIRGGKYTSLQEEEFGKYAEQRGWTSSMNRIYRVLPENDRPYCYCGYPCEVGFSKTHNYLYFKCPVPSGWNIPFRIPVIPTACNFWQKYTGDIHVKKQYDDILHKLHEKDSWTMRVPRFAHSIRTPCSECKKQEYGRICNNGEYLAICQPCFIAKHSIEMDWLLPVPQNTGSEFQFHLIDLPGQ